MAPHNSCCGPLGGHGPEVENHWPMGYSGEYMLWVGGHIFEGIRSICENASASVHVNRELNESFSVEVGVRQGCVMSPWLFNIYMDGCTVGYRE